VHHHLQPESRSPGRLQYTEIRSKTAQAELGAN
jgi:hypothetical protein